ncbi:DUF3265 domain-containing protein [Vibrio fluvialis]|nr:DUF3265 domain-containing protein [Vibrio fluvialis]MBY8012618.1 DUF3265 domain-containing protein [Vibrio fluvialis]MBY8015380.1 DUF3265 domain-containing protein [Vibrio fluvialis]
MHTIPVRLALAFIPKSIAQISTHITNSLRGIHNAWHFYYALFLMFKVVCSGFGIALFTP